MSGWQDEEDVQRVQRELRIRRIFQIMSAEGWYAVRIGFPDWPHYDAVRLVCWALVERTDGEDGEESTTTTAIYGMFVAEGAPQLVYADLDWYFLEYASETELKQMHEELAASGEAMAKEEADPVPDVPQDAL